MMVKLIEQKQLVYSSRAQRLAKRLEIPSLKELTQAFSTVVLQTPTKK